MERKELNHLISHALASAMYNVDDDLHPTDAHGIAGKLIKNDKSVKKLIEYIDQLEEESKWISVKDKLPICYKAGDWDGKMSDLVLCQDEKGEYHLANCYDYGDTNEWYDKDDFGLWRKIVKWTSIIE